MTDLPEIQILRKSLILQGLAIGYGSYGSVEDVPIDEARRQFDVNLFGMAQLTQIILPAMPKQKSGRIVNISSMGGKIYTPLGA